MEHPPDMDDLSALAPLRDDHLAGADLAILDMQFEEGIAGERRVGLVPGTIDALAPVDVFLKFIFGDGAAH